MASVVTPMLLGTIVGAIASGAAGEAASRLPTDGGAAARAGVSSFVAVFVAPWLAPFPLAMGVLALAMFAFLAAVYLAVAARDDALRDDFRRRALGAAGAMFVAAFGGLGVAHVMAPHVSGALMGGRAIGFQLVTALASVTALWALYARRWQLARVAAASQVSLILWGWVLVQYPSVVPPSLTIRDASAPRATLTLLLYALVGGAVVLFPALAYLFRTFGAERRAR
jgi:cytochrome d ubiquinol oxidase subunit II